MQTFKTNFLLLLSFFLTGCFEHPSLVNQLAKQQVTVQLKKIQPKKPLPKQLPLVVPPPIPEPIMEEEIFIFELEADHPEVAVVEEATLDEIYIPSPCKCAPVPITPIVIPIEESSFTIDTSSILPCAIEIDPYQFKSSVFPNPTQSVATVQFEVLQEDRFLIDLFSVNGKLISVLHNDILPIGRHLFSVDLNNEAQGIFLIQIVSSNQRETLKLVKQ